MDLYVLQPAIIIRLARKQAPFQDHINCNYPVSQDHNICNWTTLFAT